MEKSLEAVNQDIRTAVDTGKEEMIKQLGDFEIHTTNDFKKVKDTGTTNEEVLKKFKEEICGASEEKGKEGESEGIAKSGDENAADPDSNSGKTIK
jgi:hypothetical protein